MSKTASFGFAPSATLFSRFMANIDRLLMASARIAIRNGDLPILVFEPCRVQRPIVRRARFRPTQTSQTCDPGISGSFFLPAPGSRGRRSDDCSVTTEE